MPELEATPGVPVCACAIDKVVAVWGLPERSQAASGKGELGIGLGKACCNAVGHGDYVGKEGIYESTQAGRLERTGWGLG